MITAAEAKALYDATGVEVKQYMDIHILQKVKDSAMAGKRTCFVDIGSIGAYEYIDKKQHFVEYQVVVELKKLGYTASIGVSGDKYVPRGLADDDGAGPMYQNYGIHIGW